MISLKDKNKAFAALAIIYISSIFVALYIPQALFLQANKANPYLSAYDSPLFRVPISVIAAIIISIVIYLISLKALKKRLSFDKTQVLTRLTIVNLPLFLLLILTLHVELIAVNFINNFLPVFVIISVYALLEMQFLIPLSKNNAKEKILKIFLPAIFISFMMFFIFPMQIYLTNMLEFTFSMNKIMIILFIISLLVSMTIIRLFLLFNSEPGKMDFFVLVLLSISVCIWVQGNFILWNYGIFDGTQIPWNKLWYRGLIDGGIWIILFTSIIKMKKFFLKNMKNIIVFILLFQVFSITLFYFQNQLKDNKNQVASFKEYTLDEKDKFTFSSGTNVIILVLDEFQSDVFFELLKQDPSLYNNFEGFTYFPDTTSTHPFTMASIPSILTTEVYKNEEPYSRFIDRNYMSNSILKTLMEHNFKAEVYPLETEMYCFDKSLEANYLIKHGLVQDLQEIAYLIDTSLFRYLPHFLKYLVYNNSRWFLSKLSSNIFMEEMKPKKEWPIKISFDQISQSQNLKFLTELWNFNETDGPENRFKFYHIHGAHTPQNMNENFEIIDFKYNKSSYTGLCKALIRISRYLMDTLKARKLYDNSLIFIIGDHGSGRTSDLYINSSLPHRALTNIPYGDYNFDFKKTRAIPLMIVKKPLAKGPLQINRGPACLTDIPKTIAREFGLPDTFSGYSVFDLNTKTKRTRYYYSYDNRLRTPYPYLPEMQEYIIKGNAWDSSSWQETGKRLKAPK